MNNANFFSNLSNEWVKNSIFEMLNDPKSTKKTEITFQDFLETHKDVSMGEIEFYSKKYIFV